MIRHIAFAIVFVVAFFWFITLPASSPREPRPPSKIETMPLCEAEAASARAGSVSAFGPSKFFKLVTITEMSDEF